MSNNKITARLERWHKDPYFNIIWGNIVDDIHGRWPNGTTIHTSSIRKIEDNLCYTLNSIYLLGEPLESVLTKN